ncbi:hypothetical protein ACKI1O_05145 [Streptomyces scabiei]
MAEASRARARNSHHASGTRLPPSHRDTSLRVTDLDTGRRAQLCGQLPLPRCVTAQARDEGSE